MNPFLRRLTLTAPLSPDRIADAMAAWARPLTLHPDFERSVHPRGTVMGSVRDGRFEFQEAMYGFGGAVAVGTIERTAGGSTIRCDIRPGMFMRYSFVVLTLVYVFILGVCLLGIAERGFRPAHLIPVATATAVYGAVWFLMAADMRGLERFVRRSIADQP